MQQPPLYVADGTLGRDGNAGMCPTARKSFMVQAGEITDIECHQHPAFGSGVVELLFIRASGSAGFHGRRSVPAIGTQLLGYGSIHVFIGVEPDSIRHCGPSAHCSWTSCSSSAAKSASISSG